ncbi:MAG TPA: lytic transglycosylase domain-containing protein [Candidatus Binatia bacterium]|jgi:membrane-bound lytic murein transglycosylase D|nr:lytic transglycosylase domain-containing protein [Candidatus Binatia bacterium]
MRRPALIYLALLAGLAGCTTTRNKVPQEAKPLIAETDGPTSIDCVEHPRIDDWAERMQSQQGLRRTVDESLARGAAYLPAMRAILADVGLPEALALLPAIESGFRVGARGRHGDVGLWQLRRPAARRFGLTITRRRDDRLHPEHATRAAARYLDFLFGRYGDWPLALAAYNAGEGRVDRAMASGGYETFWQLADEGLLPATCRDYVPRFLALVRLAGGARHCAPTGRLASAS